MIDPLSVLVGVPILGPIVAWQFKELHDMRTSMERREAKIVEAYIDNARALTRLEEILDRKVDSEKELVDVLRVLLERERDR